MILRFLKWLFLKPRPVRREPPRAVRRDPPPAKPEATDSGTVGPERLAEDLPGGIGPKIAERLFEAGFRTADEVRSAPDEALLAIPGIGQATVDKLKGR
jgi:hypothetical protein